MERSKQRPSQKWVKPEFVVLPLHAIRGLENVTSLLAREDEVSFFPDPWINPHAIIVLAQDNDAAIRVWQELYWGKVVGQDAGNANGTFVLNEPRSKRTESPIHFKITQMKKYFPFKEADLIGRDPKIMASDVIPIIDGKSRHKPNRQRQVTPETEERWKRDAQKWFGTGPFSMAWLFGFAVDSPETKQIRTELRIDADFPEAIDRDQVYAQFKEDLPTRFNLLEAGRNKARYTLSNSGGNERVSISQEMAELMIISKIFPPLLFQELLKQAHHDTLRRVVVNLAAISADEEVIRLPRRDFDPNYVPSYRHALGGIMAP